MAEFKRTEGYEPLELFIVTAIAAARERSVAKGKAKAAAKLEAKKKAKAKAAAAAKAGGAGGGAGAGAGATAAGATPKAAAPATPSRNKAVNGVKEHAPPVSPGDAAKVLAVEEDQATAVQVLEALRKQGCSFREVVHEPVRTSQQAADVRGVPLETGAKAMLFVGVPDEAHPVAMLVLSAARSLDMKAVRAVTGASRKKLRMASEEDVKRYTGCIPGAVPPLGHLFPGVKTYVDTALRDQGGEVNFNAGLRTLSVVGLSLEDYLKVENPEFAAFTKPAPAAAN